LLARSGFQDGSFGKRTGLDVAPQGDEKLAGEGHNPDLAGPGATAREALVVPMGEGAVGLVAEPAPGDLDGQAADPAVAGSADAELVLRLAALVGRWRQAREGSDLLAVAEVAPGEELEPPGPGRAKADPFEREQSADLLKAPVRFVLRALPSLLLL
jgi:hypothetical protein